MLQQTPGSLILSASAVTVYGITVAIKQLSIHILFREKRVYMLYTASLFPCLVFTSLAFTALHNDYNS